ncbi:MAG: hypothetical protein U9R29_09835 [Thermodesulfobacteriota bacterium]|nr:hypothetical protein [Thermodesulfobacteriota bacterium]
MRFFYLSLMTLLLLSACQSQQESDTPQQEAATTTTITTQPQQPQPQQPPAPPLKLDVSQTALEGLSRQGEEEALLHPAPTTIVKDAKKTKKVDISTGLLFDKEANNMVEGVAGGEVKINISLD